MKPAIVASADVADGLARGEARGAQDLGRVELGLRREHEGRRRLVRPLRGDARRLGQHLRDLLLRDGAGRERPVPLVFVSPFQLNFQVPPGVSPGRASVSFTSIAGLTASGPLEVAGVAPAGLRWASRLGIAACAGLVALVGSYGGKLIHGVDYYADAFEQLKTELNPPTPKPVAKIEKVAGNTATTDNNPSPAVVVKPTVKTDATNSDTSPSVPPAPANPDGAPANTAVAVAAPSASVDFHKQVMPIFAQHCTKCHDGNKKKGGYRIDTKELAFTAGESEESPIVAGKPDESLIVKVIEGKGE